MVLLSRFHSYHDLEAVKTELSSKVVVVVVVEGVGVRAFVVFMVLGLL